MENYHFGILYILFFASLCVIFYFTLKRKQNNGLIKEFLDEAYKEMEKANTLEEVERIHSYLSYFFPQHAKTLSSKNKEKANTIVDILYGKHLILKHIQQNENKS